MRADRLITLLLILQNRGKLTARKLAEILETSERTIYRDVDSLSAAGVPIYAEKGPGGGITLLESYRTNLTGLTADEARALFMLAVPAPIEQLGLSQELNSALLKLSASLPPGQRHDEVRTRQRFYLDAVSWSDHAEPAPFLSIVQQALWQDRYLKLSYRTFINAVIELCVRPLGLVAKASVWYLVYALDDAFRVVRVSHLISVEALDETFIRPPGFDLASFWRTWCEEVSSLPPFIAVVRISPELAAELPRFFGSAVIQDISHAQPDEKGWIELSLSFEHFFDARERILSFGGAAEVITPLPLRESVADYARQTVRIYDQKS